MHILVLCFIHATERQHANLKDQLLAHMQQALSTGEARGELGVGIIAPRNGTCNGGHHHGKPGDHLAGIPTKHVKLALDRNMVSKVAYGHFGETNECVLRRNAHYETYPHCTNGPSRPSPVASP